MHCCNWASVEKYGTYAAVLRQHGLGDLSVPRACVVQVWLGDLAARIGSRPDFSAVFSVAYVA